MELHRTQVRIALSAAALGAALAIAGCGGSSSDSGKATTASLTRAADVSTSAAGYKFDMTMRETVENQTIDVTASGSASAATHDMSMDMKMNSPSSQETGTLQMQAVEHAGTIYYKLPPALTSKLPTGKPWVSISFAQIGQAAGIPGYGSLINSSSSESDPGQYLNFLRATADGTVTNLGQETLNGVATTHYHADVDLANLAKAEPASDQAAAGQLVALMQKYGAGTQLPVDVWIDGANLVRRIKLGYNLTVKGDPVTIDMTMDLRSYGTQPTPTVPSPDKTTNLLSLIHNSSGSGSSLSG
jgi:hypothetical protein